MLCIVLLFSLYFGKDTHFYSSYRTILSIFNNSMCLIKRIQLLKAMAIDDLLQLAVGIIKDIATMIKHHQFTIQSRIWMPAWQAFDVWIAGMGKLRPGTAHLIGQLQILSRWLW
jgi:hypothetical protein